MFKNIKSKIFIILTVSVASSSCMMLPHSNHHDGSYNGSHMDMNPENIDIVCGERIDDRSELLNYQYDGSSYNFHSDECLSEFKHNPDKYIRKENRKNSQFNNTMMWGAGIVVMGVIMAFMLI